MYQGTQRYGDYGQYGISIQEENEQKQKEKRLQLTHYNVADAVDDWKNSWSLVKHYLGSEQVQTDILSSKVTKMGSKKSGAKYNRKHETFGMRNSAGLLSFGLHS